MTNEATAAAISKMMQVWDEIKIAARNEYPNATDEEIFELSSRAMNKRLKLID